MDGGLAGGVDALRHVEALHDPVLDGGAGEVVLLGPPVVQHTLLGLVQLLPSGGLRLRLDGGDDRNPLLAGEIPEGASISR